jgi:hypothetical protein
VLAAIVFLVFHFLPANTAPLIQTLKPWQGLILGGLAFLAFLLLAIDVLVGLKITQNIREAINKKINKEDLPIKVAKAEEGKAVREIKKGTTLAGFAVFTTIWFRLAFLLQLVAALGGLLEFWTSRRGNKPLPKLEFAW